MSSDEQKLDEADGGIYTRIKGIKKATEGKKLQIFQMEIIGRRLSKLVRRRKLLGAPIVGFTRLDMG